MILLYIASEELSRQDRDICVRMKLPASKDDIWRAAEKAEIESLDDCELLEVCCDLQEADSFLHSLEIWNNDIFELNYFGSLLDSLECQERNIFLEKVKSGQFKDVAEANRWIFSEDSMGADKNIVDE
ncbi:hypothetical protein MUJ63_03650 [Lachnospiraceae bacterium NSJ-143]|nr:hypothetical protein [Lachnospiraceae bacterium NSJ-143]